MRLKRFRLRSIMIGIVALALLMGVVRFAAVLLGIKGMVVRVEGSNFAVGFDMAMALEERAGPGMVETSFLTECYALIPITTVLILIAVPLAFVAVVIMWRTFRARNRTGRACDRSDVA